MAISCSPPAGRIRGASSTRSPRRPARRWRPRRCAGSASSMPSKRACVGNRPLIGLPSGAPSPDRSCSLCMPGWKRSFRASPAAARLPRRSVTRSRAGKVCTRFLQTAASNSIPIRSSARSAPSRCLSHCAFLLQVSVNIGSVLVSSTRHGRPFRATADLTESDAKSSARIWYGAPATTCTAGSTLVLISRRTM